MPNEYVNAAWSFIEPYVAEADGLIFSRWIYIPHVLANGPTMIVPHLKRSGEAVVELLDDPDRTSEIAEAGRRSVYDRFLHDRHVRQYVGLLNRTSSPTALNAF